MNDPLDAVDQIFVAVLRLTPQVMIHEDLRPYAQTIEGLAHQVADELEGDSPLRLLWVGMTIQGILEELGELVDLVIDIEDEALVIQIDETIEIIMAAAFGHSQTTETEGEDYGIGD